jgi:ABC-type spermidine/putrescine transport system permease subunit II
MFDASGLVGLLFAAPAAFVFGLVGILVARKERQKGNQKMQSIFMVINGIVMGMAVIVALSVLSTSR